MWEKKIQISSKQNTVKKKTEKKQKQKQTGGGRRWPSEQRLQHQAAAPVSAERRGSVTPPAAGKLGSIMSCWPTSGDRARGANDVGIDDENDAHSLLSGAAPGPADRTRRRRRWSPEEDRWGPRRRRARPASAPDRGRWWGRRRPRPPGRVVRAAAGGAVCL